MYIPKTKTLKLSICYGEPSKRFNLYVKIDNSGVIIHRYTIPPFIVHAEVDYGTGYASRETLNNDLRTKQITPKYAERSVVDIRSFLLRTAIVASAFIYCSIINF